MLCFESVEPHTARIGIMFIHVDGSASAGSRGRFAARRRLGSANCANCANCANPCMHCRHNPSPRGNGNCTNCPTPFCLQNLSPYSGTKEFPVAAACVRAMLCRRPASRIEADRRNPVCCNSNLLCSIYTASRRRIPTTRCFAGGRKALIFRALKSVFAGAVCLTRHRGSYISRAPLGTNCGRSSVG